MELNQKVNRGKKKKLKVNITEYYIILDYSNSAILYKVTWK